MKTILKIILLSASLIIFPSVGRAAEKAATMSVEQSGTDAGAIIAVKVGCGPEYVTPEALQAVDVLNNAFGSMPQYQTAYINSYVETMAMIRRDRDIVCKFIEVQS